MSTPNPLAPQGSLLEQQAKGRSTFHVISFIGAVHVMLLCGILWTACSRDDKTKLETTNTIAGVDQYGSSAPLDNAAGGGSLASQPTNSLANVPSTPSHSTSPGSVIPPTGAGQGTPLSGTPPALPPSAPTTPAPSVPSAADNTAAIASTGGEYKVVKNDIGESIAKKHGVSMKALAAANPEVNWNRLKVNQTIKIPAATTLASAAPAANNDATATANANGLVYSVKARDTGMRIAAKYGVKWSEIRKANNLKSDTLHPGQKLTIPAVGSVNPGGDGASIPSPGSVPAASLQPTAIPVPRGPGQ